MAKKVTMQQIADEARVSKYAVSKALSGQSGVSDSTRERIIKVAMQLGYFLQQPANPPGRQLQSRETRRSNTILVLMPNVRMQHRASNYWGRIVDGVTDAVKARGLTMIVVTEHAPENFLEVLNPDGVLGIVGIGFVTNSLLLEIRKQGLPFVLVDHEDEAVPSDTLYVNNFDITRRLTNYLIGQGHKKLQFVGDIHYSESFFQRWLAFRTALEESGLETVQNAALIQSLGTDRSEHAARIEEQVRRQVRENTLPTALVCANDSLAISAVHALEQIGLRVPTEVSVTGFDDIDEAAITKPPLTTVHVDKELLGARAVDMLLHRIDHPQAANEKVLLGGQIFFRESVGRVSSGRGMLPQRAVSS